MCFLLQVCHPSHAIQGFSFGRLQKTSEQEDLEETERAAIHHDDTGPTQRDVAERTDQCTEIDMLTARNTQLSNMQPQ